MILRTTKRIIIRIIVAVAVAVILSKLKLLNIIEVSALTGRFNPNEIYYGLDNGGSGSTTSLTPVGYYGSTFYGFYNQNPTNLQFIRFKYSPGSNYNGKQYLMQFLVYIQSDKEELNSYVVYIKDTNNRISYCTGEHSLRHQTGGAGNEFIDYGPQSFTCNNVLIGTNDFYVYIVYGGTLASNSFTGMTQLIMIENNDSQILQAIQNQNNTQTQIQNNTKETNDLIKSDDTTDADSKGSDFFNNFENDSHGLSGVITAPLSFIQSLTSKSCTPLHLEIGLVDKEFDLPCATTLMQQNFPSVLEFYQTITFGVISYLILIKIFGIVKDAKNPDSDKIEVLDL